MGEKKKEWEVQRRGEENRRGMLCWRTGRGKPQEGVRGMEADRERERGIKKMGRERPDQGAVAAKVSCERGKTLMSVCVCVFWCMLHPRRALYMCVCTV